MELRQLRYFLSAVKHLSFTDAAEECCIVQSAMSQQIRALEKELGVRLFERTKRGLCLTQEGEFAAREARRLLEEAEAMRVGVRQAGLQGGALRIGCQCHLLGRSLPKALAALRDDEPEVRAYIRTGSREALLGELREGKLDCVIALYGRKMARVDWVDLQCIAQEEIWAMLPADSELAAKAGITIEAMLDEKLILYNSELHSEALNGVLSRSGVDVRRMYVESQSDIEALVAAGYGASFCARSAARSVPGIVYRPVSGLQKIQTCLAWRRGAAEEDRIRHFASFLVMSTSKTNVLLKNDCLL